MQTIDDQRLERAIDTLEEATVALREANDRMEQAFGAPPPLRPALTLVENEQDDGTD